MAERENAITAISVKGFKSFAEEQRIEIRPLTILAGANSSGKSSALQPLLLLKQTLEASYDPGPLLLHDTHVRFTSADQLLTKVAGQPASKEFEVGVYSGDQNGIIDVFRKNATGGFDLSSMVDIKEGVTLVPGNVGEDLAEISTSATPILKILRGLKFGGWRVRRNRCFLVVDLEFDRDSNPLVTPLQLSTPFFDDLLRSIIHVPGLRGNPTRAYKTTAVGKYFSGTFEAYIASVIASWQQDDDTRLRQLGHILEALGLTWKVKARALDATQVELLVGRLTRGSRGGASDLVNIADVGFGVSQTLPVLVALLAANPGQLVYLEQPEIHLHPRAQEVLATALVEAAARGVRVVAETHSSLLLLAIQTLVVEGKLSPNKIMLHWFQRDARGATKVTTGDLDRLGAYGDWPEDFYSVSAAVENRYLDAVEASAFGSKKSAKSKR